MAEIGEVIEFENQKVVVRLERKEACAKCRACTAGMKSSDMLISAENLCDARLGDMVEIALEETDFIKAVLIMYGFPFVMFLIGVFGGYYTCMHFNIPGAEYIGFGTGLVLIAVSYAIIRSQEHRWRSGNFIPKAIKIHTPAAGSDQ